MTKKYEYVDDNSIDDQLVQRIAHRENELASFEEQIENVVYMIEHADEYLIRTGNEKVDAVNKEAFLAMLERELAHNHFQYAKSRAIYGSMKMQAAKNPERHAAAKARFAAKKP